MNVLVACEESQRTATAFREMGINAYSADIIDCTGGHPEYHIKGDVLKILNGGIFYTATGDYNYLPEWDLIIAHPDKATFGRRPNGKKITWTESISRDKQRERSKTFQGIANAFARQWGSYVREVEGI